jgi:HEPN domain-containing protein
VWTGNTWHWVLKPDSQPGEKISLDHEDMDSLPLRGSNSTATIARETLEVLSMTSPNNKEVARATFGTARSIAEEAEWLLGRERWHLVVRRCQEAVELAIKAALRWAGIEAPKEHDPGHILRRHMGHFPSAFAVQIDRLALASRHLRADRERSFYGDEEYGLSAQELYSQVDAQQALADMAFVLAQVESLLAEGQ